MNNPEKPSLDRLIALVGDFPAGTVCLVGAGPGDPGLISVRGAVRLAQAQVVLYDRLVATTLLELADPSAERIFVGKQRGGYVVSQDEIHELMIARARAGRRVVRLKGGDPFVFGRGGEEGIALARAGIRYEVVSGITAAFAAPAAAGIPLTHRGLARSFALVTGHGHPSQADGLDFSALARLDTIAIYMGLHHLAANSSALIAAGMAGDTPVAVIFEGTRMAQRTIVGTLADIAEKVSRLGPAARGESPPPAMVLVGKVVALRDQLTGKQARPLADSVVVVTRQADQAAKMSDPLRVAGAHVLEAPTIEIRPIEDWTRVDQALERLDDYRWLVVTSGNGVDILFDHLEQRGLDARCLASVSIAAVGAGTGERLKKRNIRADLIPPEAVGESLAQGLIAQTEPGDRILLLRAEKGRSVLPEMLTQAGRTVDDLAIYRSVSPASLPTQFIQAWDQGRIDWITFTSPSTFENMIALLGPARIEGFGKVRIATIGPVTSAAVAKAGLSVTAEADPHTIEGLVEAIVTHR